MVNKPSTNKSSSNNKKSKIERLDPSAIQRRASDPKVSSWVTASAGTGKTKVLTDRVLRLMLDGAKPEEVLCITFTRAAASVMTNRIRDELALWASCDELTLQKKLTKLTGRKPDIEKAARARQLFAEFLDSHGGMRIQTIHSFSQSLLKRFPIESGVPPYFDVMDEQTSSALLQEAQADVLKEIQENDNTELAKAVNMITPEVSEEDFISLISQLTSRRGQLLGIFEKYGGIEGTINEVYKYLGAAKGHRSKDLNKKLLSDKGLGKLVPDIDNLKNAVEILSYGSATEKLKADFLNDWIENPEQRQEFFKEYKALFITAKGDIKKRLTTKATVAAEETLRAEADRLQEGIDIIQTMNVARGTESLLRMTGAILFKYADKKQARNLLDYDDLVYRSVLMMEQENTSSWILQKLPGDLKHILVDEAQDTNPDQWKLVSSIAKEFFTNSARKKSKDNTIFVVGDGKQSIFSFQRADPKEFATRKKYFENLVNQSGGKWREVDMEIAFRSSPAITQTVDAVFAQDEAADGLFHDELEERIVKHKPFRRGHAGLVELHPLLKAKPKEELTPWSLPLEREEFIDPAVEMAEKIAEKIKGWKDNGEKLEARNRPISPSDIMILVRRRSAFVDHMVRELKKRDIPVAGADRMSLRKQIAVMDMVALGEITLFPKDDYNLACVMKSPLIGMTDKQLEDLAVGRKGTLWLALKRKSNDKKAPKIYKAAYLYLDSLQKDLGVERPYEFYSAVLSKPCPASDKSGLAAFYTRLGFEAEDPLVEFMNSLEKFEKYNISSMQGFISWLEAGEAEVKREINLNSQTPKVHIMTVHGAKGLEAPIVFLPDTTGIPADNLHSRPKFLWPQGDRNIPLWVPRADLESKDFTRERELVEIERDREFRRLLYVAMTRSADRLYVYGSQGNRDLRKKSWYSLIKSGLENNLKDAIELIGDGEEKIIQFKKKQEVRAVNDGVKNIEKVKLVGIPEWARSKAKIDETLAERFKASEYQGSKVDYVAKSPLHDKDDRYFAKLGTIVHDLLEILPVLDVSEREKAARQYLAKPAWGLETKDQENTLKQVIAVLDDPKFLNIFGVNSRPEVAINGFIEKQGKKQGFSAFIDRLVVNDNNVTIIDYKNSRKVPEDISEVPLKYIVQLAVYKMAVKDIYPNKKIKCALLYTRKAKLIPLPATSLSSAFKKAGLKSSMPVKRRSNRQNKAQTPKHNKG